MEMRSDLTEHENELYVCSFFELCLFERCLCSLYLWQAPFSIELIAGFHSLVSTACVRLGVALLSGVPLRRFFIPRIDEFTESSP